MCLLPSCLFIFALIITCCYAIAIGNNSANDPPEKNAPSDTTSVVLSTVIVSPVPATSCPPNFDPNATPKSDCYIEAGPIRDIFTDMGDSYGSVIGAGKPYIDKSKKDRYKRGDGSVGSQLHLE